MNFESLVGHINQVQDVLQAQAAPSRPTSQTPTPTNRPVPGSADSDAAFFKCYSLKEVSLPESVTFNKNDKPLRTRRVCGAVQSRPCLEGLQRTAHLRDEMNLAHPRSKGREEILKD